jgi:hypothetical protein
VGEAFTTTITFSVFEQPFGAVVVTEYVTEIFEDVVLVKVSLIEPVPDDAACEIPTTAALLHVKVHPVSVEQADVYEKVCPLQIAAGEREDVK